jgi:hypothetical protein
MDEAIADAPLDSVGLELFAGLAPESLPASTLRDFAQLLDVDVDQLSGARSFVAADHASGGPIHPGQTIDPQADEDPVDRRGRDTESVANASWAQLERPTQFVDLLFDDGVGSMRTPARSARTIYQSELADLVPAAPPLIGRRTRNPHFLGHMGHRTA